MKSKKDEDRDLLMDETKAELDMIGKMDEIIMESDLGCESIARILKYLADKHLGVTLTEPKSESLVELLARTVDENMPAIIAAASAGKASGVPDAVLPKPKEK